jgi:hypothetical protein
MRSGQDPLWPLLLQSGHCLCRRQQGRLRVSLRHDALWVSVLPEGHRLCQPVHLDVRGRRRVLHRGSDGMRQDMLRDRAVLRRRDVFDMRVVGVRGQGEQLQLPHRDPLP